MKKQKFLLLLFAILYCSVSIAQEYSFKCNNQNRSYLVRLPSNYKSDSYFPLLLVLHGGGWTKERADTCYGFTEHADSIGYIVVYPQSLESLWKRENDMVFIQVLIDTLNKKYNINKEQIYITGHSAGGLIVNLMACDSSSGIAAFADISGVMLKSLASYYIPIQPVPYLKIHGTADNEILYNGNSYYYSVDYVINFWKNNNNINSLKDSIVLPDIDTSDNSTVIKYTYGEDSSEIVFYKIINGGHDIPDWCLNNEMGNTNRDINTPVVLWDFFKKHRYKEKETILNSYRINQTSNFKTYPNPAQNILKVEYPGLQQKEVVYKIIDLTGKILQQGELAGNIVDVSKLSKGKYLLSINFENETTSEKIIIE